ncbi:DNA-binding response regulator [Paenibacillus sp. FSL H8-0548]|uniref:response regulator n=1 Tax=Paenibacillus sp. FSL H8-0548 TaxID=1920422 RepID=UPI00096D9F41|nr:response regulator [Paenibacillus sp. FSL H8-0548]OMF37005.1 DNA-binding response regulator [Paenibacillus sp. FSL H8-0548]
MYRLLIADDEALEREGLELIIERLLPKTFHIVHAENGRLAIEHAEEHRPHIVLMDVNMPGIQGLEAIREIKRSMPETKFVMITAYDYFAYAKEALALGVKEYLVKPAKREQVIQTLQMLISELDAEKKKRSTELELRHKLSQLIPIVENELAMMFMIDHITSTDIEQLSEWLSFSLEEACAIVIAFPEQLSIASQQKIYDKISGFAKNYEANSIVSSLIDRHMAIYIHKESLQDDHLWKERATAFGEELYGMAARLFDSKISVGIGQTYSGAEGLRKSYFEAVFASNYDDHNGVVCRFDELKQGKRASQEELLESSQVMNTIPEAYVLSAMQRIREQREQQTHSVMDRAKHYIQSKFAEELSLEEVADSVHLNPHYFSKIFKQQMGTTFIDYVTALRIDKAKSLMASGKLSLKEVCFEVGYKDPNYFSRVFKKVTGVPPSDYRE